jgi:streptomycin 3"-adenylyltransferase
LYLHGSLALGDFTPTRSDVDLLGVTAAEISPEGSESLAAALAPKSLPCPAGGLELSLVTSESLREVEAAPPFEIHIATDTKAKTQRVVDGRARTGDSDLVMHYAVLRSRGVALLGPPPERVFPEVPRGLLLRALRDELDWATRNASPSYQVLNAARAWRFFEDNSICSKSEGGEWARERVTESSVIDEALAYRRGERDVHPDAHRASAFLESVMHRLAATPPDTHCGPTA